MKKYYSDVIQFTGSHYDFGFMQGKQLRESPILANRKKQWAAKRKRHFTINEQEAVQLFTEFSPQMLDELQGLADALDWSFADALREFGGYYVDYAESGCSILTSTDYLIRNYDSHPAYYEGRYVIYKPSDGGYTSIGPSMQITGRTDGMNEKGLAMGYNFINRVRSEDGFLCNMIGRMILETCARVDEAVSLLKAIPHRTSFSYMLLDASGKSVVVEASPRKVTSRNTFISTNHFEILLEENRFRTDDSMRRQDILEKHTHPSDNMLTAYKRLNDIDKEIFSEKYDASAGTIHTAIYEPNERKAFFAIGGNRMPVIFDLDDFLKGKQSNITKIKGELAYDEPFVNMEFI